MKANAAAFEDLTDLSSASVPHMVRSSHAQQASVRQSNASLPCRYLPIGGFKPFVDETMKLAYGENADVLKNKQVAAVQALSGTGACRLMAEFQKRYMPKSKVLIPKPTWSNHHNIWRDAGVDKAEFRYYDPRTQGLDFDGMMEDLKVRCCACACACAHACVCACACAYGVHFAAGARCGCLIEADKCTVFSGRRGCDVLSMRSVAQPCRQAQRMCPCRQPQQSRW